MSIPKAQAILAEVTRVQSEDILFELELLSDCLTSKNIPKAREFLYRAVGRERATADRATRQADRLEQILAELRPENAST